MPPAMMPRRALVLALAVTAAPAAAIAAEPTLRVDLGGGVSLDLVLVPAGSFTQGSPAGERDHQADEMERRITISEPYYIGKYPVTVGQFTRFTGATRYRTEAERGASGGSGWDGKALVQRKEFNWQNPGFPQAADHPVTIVTYDDARAFADWASRVAGRAVSLPTEAQWENAYRAGSKGAFYAVDSQAPALGWFKDNALGGTHPVGKKQPNALGLFDMAGNVYEWCADWYAPYPDGAARDPLQTRADTSDKARRVLRGGSWLKDTKHGRAAARYRNTPGSRNADNGFRVVASTRVSPQPAAPPPGTPPTSKTRRAPNTGSAGCDGIAVGAFGCAGTALLSVVAMVLLFVRKAGGGSRSPIRFRTGPDGFWIDAPKLLAGSTLHYRHRASTGSHEGHVVLEPSDVGQYVYTGAPPLVVDVVRVIPAQRAPARGGRSSGGSGRVVHQQHHHHDDHHQHHHHDDSFRGYPSAY